ncbi:CoA-binding protein [Lipomyces oligophaga]|uniref:CoA-binding protein n=1 Tax=Lipomyces oligophaga TaxID=45792 RepID=UPI0034CFCB0B
MTTSEALRQFFTAHSFAVVGASTDPSKYGNKVLKWYLDRQITAYPINPKRPTIYGITAIPTIAELLDPQSAVPNATAAGDFDSLSVSIITPPRISEATLRELSGIGPHIIKGVWLQPGSFDDQTLEAAKNLNVIAHGHCILVEGDDARASLTKL